MSESDSFIDFDAPNFVDFTSEIESPSRDYFFRGETKPSCVVPEDDIFESDGGQDERVSGPSPKKKQRMETEGNRMSPMPRRSPRLEAAAQTNHYVISKGNVPDKYKTTEELELQKIARMREELAKTRKNHEVTYKKAIAKGKPVNMKSSQPPTLPQGFHFRSDERIKGTADRAEDTSVKDFAKTLRSALPNVDGATKGNPCQNTTRPKPFKLTEHKSMHCLSNTQKYKSTAEQIMTYKDHFRSNPNLSSNKGGPASNTRRAQSPGLTIAKTPTLSTRGRSRSLKLLTREEEEEREFEEHQKQQFKAHAVNRKILKEHKQGVPKVPPKPPTEVKEFNLHTSTSLTRHKSNDSVDESTNEFHARAVNRKILEGPTGVKAVDTRPLTVAQSPAFALKSRMRSRERLPPPEEVPTAVAPKVSTKSAPYFGVPFRPHLEPKWTVPKPFEVEQHSKDMLKKKQQKIQQVLEEEKKAREFRATVLPSDSPDQLPPKKPQPVTAIEPFHLSVDDRGEKYKKEWQSKIEEEKEKARAKAQFHASSNKTIFKTPFVPEKSNRPLTEMSSFTLNTDQRAVKREHFNQQHKAHEAEIEAFKRQREERMVKEENEAIAQLRQDMVHKATDIKKYKQVKPRPSDKPLTEAQSPYLLTQRLRSREMSD